MLAASTSVAYEKTALSFEEAVAVYSSGLFPGITKVEVCGDYRVFVVWANGTDMLFMDKLVPADNGSILAATDGLSFAELNYYEASNDIESMSCELLGSENLRIVGRISSVNAEADFEFSILVDTQKHTYTYEDTQPK